MGAYVAGVVVSAPEKFPWLMMGSCGAVMAAAVAFFAFAVKTRFGRVDEVGDGGGGYGSGLPGSPLSP